MITTSSTTVQDAPTDDLPGMLSPSVVRKIDCALRRVGQFGEVRLVMQKGRLRFIEVLQSEEVRDEPH
jgi:hypothetical protein